MRIHGLIVSHVLTWVLADTRGSQRLDDTYLIDKSRQVVLDTSLFTSVWRGIHPGLDYKSDFPSTMGRWLQVVFIHLPYLSSHENDRIKPCTLHIHGLMVSPVMSIYDWCMMDDVTWMVSPVLIWLMNDGRCHLHSQRFDDASHWLMNHFSLKGGPLNTRDLHTGLG